GNSGARRCRRPSRDSRVATRPSKRPPPDSRAPEPPHPGAGPLSEPKEPILVGRIVGAWGVRGRVRVAPFNDPRSSLLLRLPVWWLRAAGAAPRVESRPRADARLRDEARPHAVRVEDAKPHGGDEIVAKLVGVDDRDTALALKGFEVLLSREQFPEPEPDEVYWADLIGCK